MIDLPETQKRVLDAIGDIGEISTGNATTSVVVTIEGAKPGPTIVLRGDMDALPMPEDTGLDFGSEISGRMHACGHDSHVAMLTGAGHLLAERRDELAGTVKLIFQPGEEGFHGAKVMIDEGVLESPSVESAFAIHITPNLPSGQISTRPGAVLASADTFEIVITGQGGHASMPHGAIDPIPVAAEIVGALQTMVTRRIEAFAPAVLSVTKISAGTTTNVIPEVALMEGTLRAVSANTRAKAHELIPQVAAGVAAAHGATATVEITDGYPVTVNDESFAAFAEGVAVELLGDDGYTPMKKPAMGAEDFSYVLESMPGAMAFLGVCPPDVARYQDAHSCHSNRMRIDEDAMAVGAAMHAAIALRFADYSSSAV